MRPKEFYTLMIVVDAKDDTDAGRILCLATKDLQKHKENVFVAKTRVEEGWNKELVTRR